MSGIPKGMVSQIASGRSVPTNDELNMICGVMDCRREDLYSAQMLELITGKETAEAAKRDTTKKVRMTEPVAAIIDEFGARYKLSRDEAARMLVMIGNMAVKGPVNIRYEELVESGYEVCEMPLPKSS